MNFLNDNKWLDLVVCTSTEGQEIVCNILMQYGAQGTSIMDKADIPDVAKPGEYWEIYDETLLDNMPDEVEVHAWFPLNEQTDDKVSKIKSDISDLKTQDFEVPMGNLTVRTELIDNIDWGESWKADYKISHIGKHIVVKPDWLDYNAEPDDKVIEINPGMAFGTGMHESTFLSMELLEKYIKSDSVIMDIGTGSGILAIGSAILGAKKVLAVDIDTNAVREAKENVINNGFEDIITVSKSNLLDENAILCDIAVANIAADPVLMLMPNIAGQLNNNGIFICSGIIKNREADILEASKKYGFSVKEKKCSGDWIAFALQIK